MNKYYWLCTGITLLSIDIMHATEFLKPKRVYMRVRRKDESKKNSAPLAPSPKTPALDTTEPVLRKTYAAYQKTMREQVLAQLKEDYTMKKSYTNRDSQAEAASLYKLIEKMENPCPCFATYAPCKECDIADLFEGAW